MHATDWIQLGLFIGLLALITKPLGLYWWRRKLGGGETARLPLELKAPVPIWPNCCLARGIAS